MTHMAQKDTSAKKLGRKGGVRTRELYGAEHFRKLNEKRWKGKRKRKTR